MHGDTVMTTVHDALLDKHPLGKPPDPSTLLGSTPGTVNGSDYFTDWTMTCGLD